MTSGLLLAFLMGTSPALQDTVPVVTLTEALEQSVRLDPDYVAALGQLENAEWGRRAARLVFLLPTVSASGDYSEFSSSQFNVGIGQQANASSRVSLDARYEIFTGGRKLNTARQSDALLEASRANELGERFLAALETERDYYNVLSGQELLEVARERLRRAEEQFSLARARVAGGATVQSDSLQVLLEVKRAQAALLTRVADLTIARLQLGRRVGSGGPVDAARLDSTLAPVLPLALGDAVQLALTQGPAWRQARASERAAESALRARRGAYLPTIALFGSISASDIKFFPEATTRRSAGIQLSWSLWDGGVRELGIKQLEAGRDVARAIRDDLELAARRDVTEAFTEHELARQTFELAEAAAQVAAEVLRVQDARYRAGANTVLDLLEAQSQLVQAQAEMVQARYAARLARAGLEAMLGRRLSPDSQVSAP
jgi:outer membrane protein